MEGRHGGQRWELVWQGDGEGQASVVAGGLEAQGIRARVRGYQPLPEAYPTWARDNWAVYVPTPEAERARAHLRESGEEDHVMTGDTVEGGGLVTLQLAVLGLIAVLVISLLGAMFSGWGA